MIKVVLAVIAIVAVIGFGYTQISKNDKALLPDTEPDHDQPTIQSNQTAKQESSGGYGMKKPFYSKDGISLQHYWPSEGSFSAEETEILLFNDNSSNLQVKSFDLVYMVEGKTYLQKSGTWEKFATKESWERIEYIMISPQYYKGELLLLTPGQKGKLHWHIQFGSQPLDGKQTVTVKLTLLKDGQAINIDEQFTRLSGTVVSKEDH